MIESTDRVAAWKLWQDHAEAFVRAVVVLCCGVRDENGHYVTAPDPGARAALRLGLRKPVEGFNQAAHRAVFYAALGERAETPELIRAAWLANPSETRLLDPARERAYYAVAAMIAAQARDARDQSARTDGPAGDPVGGLGASVAAMDRGLPLQEETPREMELRALTKQSFEGIHRSLPDLVGHLRARQIEVDWARLLRDLSDWPYARERVAKRWNQDYYRARHRQRDEGRPAQSEGGDMELADTQDEERA